MGRTWKQAKQIGGYSLYFCTLLMICMCTSCTDFGAWDGIYAHLQSLSGSESDSGNTDDSSLFQSWFDNNWKKRISVTFTNPTSENLSHFPLLVVLDPSSNVYGAAAVNGEDIRMVAGDNQTLLDYEIELWDTGGTSYIWVRLPFIGASAPASFYLYFDNDTSGDGQNAAGVWTSGYLAVWHLGEEQAGTGSIDVYRDSAGGQHLDDYVSATGQDGMVGQGQEFDGIDDYLEIADLGMYDQVTYTAWVDRQGGYGSYGALINNDNWPSSNVHCQFRTNDSFGFSVNGNNPLDLETTYRFDSPGWHFIAAVYEKNLNTITYYVDGIEDSQISYTTANQAQIGPGRIASWNDGGSPVRHFQGYIDELRVSNTARSAGWVQAQYEVMENSDSHVIFGDVESR